MCTGNTVCHKVPNPNNDAIPEKKYKKLLNNYLSKISNPNMRNFIKFKSEQNVEHLPENKTNFNLLFDEECGITDEQMHFLSNPHLENVIIGFDMDSTLHQTAGIIDVNLKNLINLLSNLTKSKITYDDIGEYYFGGKERLKKMKTMFQNLSKTIGTDNVYMITANQSGLVKEIIPELYSKLFDIRFIKENVRVTIPKKLTKYDIIKDIMKIG